MTEDVKVLEMMIVCGSQEMLEDMDEGKFWAMMKLTMTEQWPDKEEECNKETEEEGAEAVPGAVL